MKKRIALLLCVVLLVAMTMTACSSEKDALVGRWEGNLDMTEVLNEAMAAEMGELMEYFTFDEFMLTYNLTFTKEDTYSISIDRNSAQAAFSKLMVDIENGMYAYTESLLREEGLDMTVEEFMELSGMSMDDLLDDIFSAMDVDALVNDLVEESASEGNYEVKDGKIMLSDGLDYKPDPAYYHTYSLEKDTLIVEQGTIEAESEAEKLMYPMILHKAG